MAKRAGTVAGTYQFSRSAFRNRTLFLPLAISVPTAMTEKEIFPLVNCAHSIYNSFRKQ